MVKQTPQISLRKILPLQLGIKGRSLCRINCIVALGLKELAWMKALCWVLLACPAIRSKDIKTRPMTYLLLCPGIGAVMGAPCSSAYLSGNPQDAECSDPSIFPLM